MGDYNDEQIIKVDLEKAEKAGVKYLYFYMFGSDIDAKTAKMIDTLDKTHYHLFDNKTNVNFHRVSNAAKLHSGLLGYQPEAREVTDEEEQPAKNNLWVGCYLVHLKEKTWTVESLKAYAILNHTKEKWAEKVGESAVKYNFYGDQASVIEGWARMIE